MEIGYLTEDPAPDYVRGLNAAKTLEDLVKFVGLYRRVAGDALEVVRRMDDLSFYRWRAGLKLERAKQFAGEEWANEFGAVLLPAVMMHVSLVAEHFRAPWGCAYIRCRDEKVILERNGVARLVRK